MPTGGLEKDEGGVPERPPSTASEGWARATEQQASWRTEGGPPAEGQSATPPPARCFLPHAARGNREARLRAHHGVAVHVDLLVPALVGDAPAAQALTVQALLLHLAGHLVIDVRWGGRGGSGRGGQGGTGRAPGPRSCFPGMGGKGAGPRAGSGHVHPLTSRTPNSSAAGPRRDRGRTTSH